MPSLTWAADGPPQPDGTVGGDGAGESVSIRYRAAENPCAIITSYWFVRDRRALGDSWPEGDPPFDVENMIVALVCIDPEDPGGTETWSDIEYETPAANTFETDEEALRIRDRYVAQERADFYTWDGEPRV